jgi:hypothetical protein
MILEFRMILVKKWLGCWSESARTHSSSGRIRWIGGGTIHKVLYVLLSDHAADPVFSGLRLALGKGADRAFSVLLLSSAQG